MVKKSPQKNRRRFTNTSALVLYVNLVSTVFIIYLFTAQLSVNELSNFFVWICFGAIALHSLYGVTKEPHSTSFTYVSILLALYNVIALLILLLAGFIFTDDVFLSLTINVMIWFLLVPVVAIVAIFNIFVANREIETKHGKSK
jgi:hypothetical protein